MLFSFFFSGYKRGGKYKYPQKPDAKHSRYGTIRKKWEHKKWVARLNGAKTYMCFPTSTSFLFLIELKIQRKGKRMSLEKTFRGIHIIIKAAESYGFYKDG